MGIMGFSVLEEVRRSGVKEKIEEEKDDDGREEDAQSETGEDKNDDTEKKKDDGSSDFGLARLFPKMVLNVLLVEADDSTRQIIAALLRKCSYRVAAVPDGLKAWEILRGRPHNVDLILTEVDLPSISGYALLTLIMEHELCKNIPVIMMSSQDSISTVYKCMLRGAADYLIKPIRRNELRNLWQHVWRRQSSLAAGNCPQDESVGQEKHEASYENNASSNNSSRDMACIKRSDRCIEKGSDDQSSCTKPDLEAENVDMDLMRDNLQPLWVKFLLNDKKMQKHDVQTKYGSEADVFSSVAEHINVAKINVKADTDLRSRSNVACEVCDDNDVLINPSKKAFDFMGASGNQNYCSSNVKNKLDPSPHLDLSLKTSHPSGFEIQVAEARHALKHSNSSAFMPYSNRTLQPLHEPLASSCNQRELGADSDRRVSNTSGGCNSDAPGPTSITQRNFVSSISDRTKDVGVATSCTQQVIHPIQIPIQDLGLNNQSTSYSLLPPMFCKQSSASPIPSPSSASHLDPCFRVSQSHHSTYRSNSENLHDRVAENANDSSSRTPIQDRKLNSFEDQEHISHTTDQSASSSFCNGSVSHLNSMAYGSACGSNSNMDQAGPVRNATDSKNEIAVFSHNASLHRSIQREAALTKFRLKRKERCYEKKVRYESRKKLAEQRPRIKGQFVRQPQIDPPLTETG
ncbi:hypothetical protein K2173_017127 [Erythroxylum novogranatense]|uniref:Two-component response regulator-like APRR5 n=1 Tax=Erythroxylum novogranatense TaxID=1862640 RepID=A0AAV8U5W6_9ROSI|nr:hypothetical protein K2173_017127 [Erythroxylum novogranatense]